MVTFHTNHGDIVIKTFDDKAPETVKNFLDYCREGFYNNTIFHRVINGFMIQGGGFEPGKQKITVAMNEITGNAGIGHRFDRCRHLAMEWVGIVVANPCFKQIAKNIQRVGLAGFPR